MDFLTVLLPNWHWANLLLLPGLLIGFTIHELGHNLMAYALGDNSQVKHQRLSINPFQHISWFGTVLFMLFGIGWPKPMRFNITNFKDRYLDTFLVALAGPTASLSFSALAFISLSTLIWGASLTQGLSSSEAWDIIFFNRHNSIGALSWQDAWQSNYVWVIAFTNRLWTASFILAVTSLLPLPPFDGFTVGLSFIGLLKEKRIEQLNNEQPSPVAIPQAAKVSIPFETNFTPATNPPSKKQAIADIHFKAGADYHRHQKYDDAIARYRQALKIDATYGPAYVNLGLAHKAKKQYNKAIHAWQGAGNYAEDEASKTQAWIELQNLEQFKDPDAMQPPPELFTNQAAQPEEPWRNTTTELDWPRFALGIITFLTLFSCLLLSILNNLLS